MEQDLIEQGSLWFCENKRLLQMAAHYTANFYSSTTLTDRFQNKQVPGLAFQCTADFFQDLSAIHVGIIMKKAKSCGVGNSGNFGKFVN